MYIEGNALILGDSSYLEHHGILGQKWGVRRFQNKDGTRTAAGKARDQKNAAKQVVLANRRTRNQWQYQNSFTKAQDKLTNKSRDSVRKMAVDALNGERKVEYEAAVEEYDAATNYRYDEYRKEENKYLAIAGMASGDRYPMLDTDKFDQDTRLKWDAEFYMYSDGDQGKYNSYDYFLVAKGENPNKVFDRAMKARNNIESIADKDVDDILGDYKDHPINSKVLNTTIKTTAGDALKERIVDMATSASDYTMVWEHQISYTDDEIKSMKNDIKKYEKEAKRLGLIHSDLSIEDGTLYLSHHGIRGQRWGVRRFQNRDGSLTNAGRKRLGYATKGAAQAVGKAFKAGVKTGVKAAKAVKSHHEKKEAEKLAKKKEKASRTRLGVMANKELFTNEEIKKLNDRFKLEDEMKMATLQKGVEIARAVGTIAQNVGTVAKTYEDVTGQSLSPIKRKAAEEKARQDKEDRERRIAREDADEARKAAKEERDIAIHEQTLRKAIASADTQEFTAQKTKAEADSSILDLYKKGQDFNGGSGTDSTGQSWMEKAKSGGKNPFDDMIANRDPEYAQIRKEHDEKVARKERIAELERREKERQAEKEAAAKQSQPQQKQGGGDDDALFSQKGSLPIDKDRYRNNRAMEKAKQVKEDAAEERAKKQDEKAAKATIDDMMEARRQFTNSARANSNGAFDRETAANYIKGKAKELPSKLNPINAIAKKITNRALKEEEDNARKALEDEYKKTSRSQGRDEANYTMYYNRVNALQAQGYSERQAKKVADTENPFSSKRNRRFEYNEKVGEIETTHRKNSKEINKAEKASSDKYYELRNKPGYEWGTPKREALERKFAEQQATLAKLREDNDAMLDREKKKAKKILEHSFSIQNGVLFVDSSDGFAHHGIRGQRWGVRRFQNPDGSLTEKGRKHYEKAIEKLDRKQVNSDNRRGALERRHPYAVTTSAILTGAAYAALMVASAANPAMVVAGSAIAASISALGTHVDYSVAEAWEARGTRRRQKKRKEYEEMLNHDGLIVSDGTLYLEHHGIKGQRWGVRRFQNPDGTRTEAGKKHDAKLAAKAERKQAKADMKAAKAAAKAKAKDIKLTEKAENLRKREIERYEKMAVKQPRYKEAYETMSKHAKESDRSELLQINSAANIRGTGQAIVSALVLSTFVPTPIAVAGGIAIAKAMKMNNVDYARTVTTSARLNKEARERKLKEAQSIKIEHSSDGMLIQNGTLFINAGEPYLEHHGVKGMKWGKHLMAGKGVDAQAGGGGGFAEDDEKLKEMAKKAGMSVAEYRTKMAGKIGGAKRISVKNKHLVIDRSRSGWSTSRALAKRYLPFDSENSAARPKDTRSFKQKAYEALGGKYKTQASEAHKDMVHYKNEADDLARRANAQSRAVKNAKKKGAVQDYIANKEGARQLETEAKSNRFAQWDSAKKANSAQWKYDHSIAGLYDKATGKYKQSHKKTKVPKLMDQAKYYYKEGSNNKLYNNGASKAKTAKEQAKAEVWKAADHVVNSHSYYNQSYDPTVTAYGLDTAYRKEAVKYGRLAEGSYRRASALGKQASGESSTSSRPRARKKKHTSGGTGVHVRRPGRKPVSRTKRVTQSSTGVKRRGSTGTRSRVRRGA